MKNVPVRHRVRRLLSAALILSLSACATTQTAQRIGGVQEVVQGTVTGVRPVQLPDEHAEQITIRLASGRMIAVTQTTGETFQAGDKVNVLSGNGITSVTH